MKPLITRRLIQAIEFSATAHKKQERLVSGVPYISHPFAVAMILSNAGYSENVIIAGLLHDVVEDTDTDDSNIENVFGREVADMVRDASENKLIPSRPDRKTEHLERIRTASDEAKAIIAADMLHNRLCALMELESGKTKEDISLGATPQGYITEATNKLAAIEHPDNRIVQELKAVLTEITNIFEK